MYSLDDFLWCYRSNETSSTNLMDGSNTFSDFTKSEFSV